MSLAPNLKINLMGDPKSGKTYFALTAPAPIKVYSFDGAASLLASRYFSDKEIEVERIALPVVESEYQVWALPVWDAFKKSYDETVASAKYKTVVLDPAPTVWQICHQAVAEEREKMKLAEVRYHEPNLRMTALFSRAEVAGMNIIVANHLKESRDKEGNITGEYEIDGWKRTENNCDINVLMKAITRGEGAKAETIMRLTIKNTWFGRELWGQYFDDATFDDLLALLGV